MAARLPSITGNTRWGSFAGGINAAIDQMRTPQTTTDSQGVKPGETNTPEMSRANDPSSGAMFVPTTSVGPGLPDSSNVSEGPFPNTSQKPTPMAKKPATVVESDYATPEGNTNIDSTSVGPGPGLPAPSTAAQPAITAAQRAAEARQRSLNQQLQQVESQAPETLSSALARILAGDSDLMRQARYEGLSQVAGRGMLNSSLAAGAAQASLLNRGIDIGRGDVDVLNTDRQNKLAFLRGQLGQEAGFIQGLSSQIVAGDIQGGLQQLGASITERVNQQLRDYQVEDRDFAANRSSLQDYAANSTAITQSTNDTVTRIATDDSLDDATKEILINQAITNGQAQLATQWDLMAALGLV